MKGTHNSRSSAFSPTTDTDDRAQTSTSPVDLSIVDRKQLEDILLNGTNLQDPPWVCQESTVAAYWPPADGPRARRLLHVLEAAHELLVRTARTWVTGRSMLNEPSVVCDYLKVHFAGADVESFVAVFLDVRLRVIAVEELSRGTLTQASVYPREVVRRAMHYNAASMIVSHCHPSGDLEPSAADSYLTELLRGALSLVDVRLIDHVIVCGQRTLSLAQYGLA